MKKTTQILISCFMPVCVQVNAQSSTPDLNIPGTNGVVNTLLRDGNTIYAGGSFSGVGYNTGGFVKVKTNNDKPIAQFPFLNGTVYDAVPDGSGGWYAGGAFSITVAGTSYSNLVHITAGGAIASAFNPQPNSTVRALALVGSTLYVGGSFSLISGANRTRLAALNKTNGNETSWNPDLNGDVYTIQAQDSMLSIGGSFTLFNGKQRAYFTV